MRIDESTVIDRLVVVVEERKSVLRPERLPWTMSRCRVALGRRWRADDVDLHVTLVTADDDELVALKVVVALAAVLGAGDAIEARLEELRQTEEVFGVLGAGWMLGVPSATEETATA